MLMLKAMLSCPAMSIGALSEALKPGVVDRVVMCCGCAPMLRSIRFTVTSLREAPNSMLFPVTMGVVP